jgi:hypothetical protein
MNPPHRFTSLDQAAIFVCGRLEGLSGSTKFDLDYEISSELADITQLLKEQIKLFADQKEQE